MKVTLPVTNSTPILRVQPANIIPNNVGRCNLSSHGGWSFVVESVGEAEAAAPAKAAVSKVTADAKVAVKFVASAVVPAGPIVPAKAIGAAAHWAANVTAMSTWPIQWLLRSALLDQRPRTRTNTCHHHRCYYASCYQRDSYVYRVGCGI